MATAGSAAATLRCHHQRLSLPSASANQLQHAASLAPRSPRRRTNLAQVRQSQRSQHGRGPPPCGAAPQQEAGPTESADFDDASSAAPGGSAAAVRGAPSDSDLEPPPRRQQQQKQRSNLMTTLEQIEALDSVQSSEAILEDRGEAVFALVGAAVAFGAGVWAVMGPEKGAEYFAGYLLEQSLSVDNLFVFILVFNYLQVPKDYQPKVLTYGLLSAAVLRAIMILGGATLIEHFHPVLLAFAGILLVSSFKLLVTDEEEEDDDLSDNFIVTLCRRFIPVSDSYDSDNFFTVVDGVKTATPLLLALAVVELSDVVFAVDSVPAVFGVTQDPFIVYSSNLFAILSLRALYGFVATIMSELRFLNKAVALVLGFVGAKMIAEFGGFGISTQLSLAVVASLLTGGVGLSLLLPIVPPKDQE